MPLTMFLWVLGGLGLVGVPGTAGFVSKWYLLQATLERGAWPLAVAILLSSLLAVIYVWRVIETAYFQPPPEGHDVVREAPLSLLIPTAFLIGASLYFGLFTEWSAGVAGVAARELLGVAQ
jgi:multicomponent Na+:H+ antiporter subunit D